METHQLAKSFVARSNLRGLTAVVADWALIVILVYIGSEVNHWAAWLVLAWPIGLLQFAIGEGLAHEASHHNLFKTRSWNTWGEWLYCIPFLYGMADYRKEHSTHHSKLGQPEDHLVKDYEIRGLYLSPPKLFWIYFCMPLLGLAGIIYFKAYVLGLFSVRTFLKMIVFWTPSISIFASLGCADLLLWGWFLPLGWSYSSFVWWSEIRDHYNTKSGTRTDVGWLNRVTHNNGFHDVHHRYPSIPWYNLPDAHQALTSDPNADTCNGLIDAFRQIKANCQPHCKAHSND